MSRSSLILAGAATACAAIGAWYVNRKVQMGSAIFRRRWFSEVSQMWPGQAMSLEIRKILFQGRSMFQDVMVFESTTYGKVLVLDGAIQCTERDEFSYQEMMVHVPMHVHPDPMNVLIIGGGDGGCLREVLRHPNVQEVDLVEIDEMVIDVSKRFLPHMSAAFEDPRVDVLVQDGNDFLKTKKKKYDVIIVDSSDPEGPAGVLFNAAFYDMAYEALKDDGVMSAQGECIWLDIEVIENLKQNAKRFAHVGFGLIQIPTYPCGSIGVFTASKRGVVEKPHRPVEPEVQEALRYYTPAIHEAAFVHPRFFKTFSS